MSDFYGSLLGSIGENNRRIKILLRKKSQMINEVQSAMDQKARTKTPLNERQQQTFHEFTGVFAREGGNLQQSLMKMDNTIQYGIEKHKAIQLQCVCVGH